MAVSVTIDNALFLDQIIKELEPFGSVDIQKNQTIVSIVGNEIAQTENVLQKLFDALKEVSVTMVSYGGITHNISLLVPGSDKHKTLQLLNKGLFGM